MYNTYWFLVSLVIVLIAIIIYIVISDWATNRPINKAPQKYCNVCGCEIVKRWNDSKTLYDGETGMAYFNREIYWSCPKVTGDLLTTAPGHYNRYANEEYPVNISYTGERDCK